MLPEYLYQLKFIAVKNWLTTGFYRFAVETVLKAYFSDTDRVNHCSSSVLFTTSIVSRPIVADFSLF